MTTTNALTNYAENELLDHMMGTGTWTMPTGTFLQLHTGPPGEDGDANIATFTTRTEITTWGAAASLAIANSGATAITGFSSTETITHWSSHDAATSGNGLFYGDFATGRSVGSGVTLTIADGDLDIDFASTDLATYAGNAALEHLVGRTSMTSPTNLYVQFHTGAPGAAGTSNIANLTTRSACGDFSAASGGTTDNDSEITATGTATETLSDFSIFDATSAGNCFWHFSATASQAVAASEAISIAAGSLDFTLS